jgi:hypothetical protein
MSKSFVSLPVPFKGTLFQNCLQVKFALPKAKRIHAKESPSSKYFLLRRASDPAEQLWNLNISANSKPNSKKI